MASHNHHHKQQYPSRPSTSRLHQAWGDELSLNEKAAPLSLSQSHRGHEGLPLPTTCRHEPSRCLDCQKRRNLRAWMPVIAYAASTLGFLVAIGWYRDELFTGQSLSSLLSDSVSLPLPQASTHYRHGSKNPLIMAS